jgi:antitoxin (DNA-binding transcriptional repressor) of toxin-antitoxin stability system
MIVERGCVMPMLVDLHEAITNLSRLVDQTLAGEVVIIMRDGQPVARLVPIRQERVPGLVRGQVHIAPDFDEPLPEEELRSFEPE